MQAVADGEDAELGNISPRLAANLPMIRDINAAWIEGGSPVRLSFALSPAPIPTGEGVSLLFSCGVDSFYSLIQHCEEIDNLVIIQGFDFPLAEVETFALVEAHAREVAEIFSKKLILVRTNLHWERPRIPCHWRMYGGAALAAVAHALTPIHKKIYIASSSSYAYLQPQGTHPLLDPLWSTEELEIVHDGGESRIEKLRAIVLHPEALARLDVCWEFSNKGNCCMCEKCLRTMLGLRALGVKRCVAFPDELRPEVVSAQELHKSSAPYWKETLCFDLPDNLRRAVQSAIRSYECGLPPSTGKPKREIKRWLYAARNAWRALIAAF
jgi:hypothetical protein